MSDSGGKNPPENENNENDDDENGVEEVVADQQPPQQAREDTSGNGESSSIGGNNGNETGEGNLGNDLHQQGNQGNEDGRERELSEEDRASGRGITEEDRRNLREIRELLRGGNFLPRTGRGSNGRGGVRGSNLGEEDEEGGIEQGDEGEGYGGRSRFDKEGNYYREEGRENFFERRGGFRNGGRSFLGVFGRSRGGGFGLGGPGRNESPSGGTKPPGPDGSNPAGPGFGATNATKPGSSSRRGGRILSSTSGIDGSFSVTDKRHENSSGSSSTNVEGRGEEEDEEGRLA
jgi:hypothetical protein